MKLHQFKNPRTLSLLLLLLLAGAMQAQNAAAAGSASQFDAKGELTISGVTRTNTMPVNFERTAKDKIKVKGATTVKMTDFGIKPPAPSILGLSPIKTGDEVKLTFEWPT